MSKATMETARYFPAPENSVILENNMSKATMETARAVQESKLKYWTERTEEASAAMRAQAGAGCSLATWEQQVLLYNRCFTNMLVAQSVLDNMPRLGGGR